MMKYKIFRLFIKSKRCYQSHGIWILMAFVLIIYFVLAWSLGGTEEGSLINKYSNTINTLFSGFAFAALIYTISQQRADLELQRRQIKLSIKEQKVANAEFTQQNKNLELQRFDSTYFNMISNSKNLISNASFVADNNKYVDFAIFNYFINRLFSNNSDFQKRLFVWSSTDPNNSDKLKTLTSSYNEIELGYNQVYQQSFVYINSLLFIIDKIKKSHFIAYRDKLFYYDYLEANFSNSFKEYLFYRYLFEKSPKLDLEPILKLIDYYSVDFTYKKTFYPNIDLVDLFERRLKKDN